MPEYLQNNSENTPSSGKKTIPYKPFKPIEETSEELPDLDSEYDKSLSSSLEKLMPISPLSEKEFDTYFDNKDFKQGKLGNCYFVSALRSLMESKYYKKLIMSSISLQKNNAGSTLRFIVKLPLGEVSGKKISIEKDDINQKQYIIKDGKKIERSGISSGCVGVKIIEAAYNEYILGKDNGHLDSISGGFGSLALINLLGTENAGMFNFAIPKQISDKGGYEVIKMKMTKLDSEQIKNLLLKFNPHSTLITLNSILRKEGGDTKSYLINNKKLQYNHAYSLIGVEKEGSTLLSIRVTNPRDTSKIITFSYDEFMNGFSGICGVALKKTFMNSTTVSTTGKIYDIRNRRDNSIVRK